MQKLKQIQDTEKRYIKDHYLGKSIEITSAFQSLSGAPVEWCSAKIDGRKYKLYRNYANGITLIPKETKDFSEDFGPIYKVSENTFGKPSFSFQVFERRNGTVTSTVFSFQSELFKEGCPQVTATFSEYDDENNNLEVQRFLSGKTLPHFVASDQLANTVKSENTITINVARGDEETRYNVSTFNLANMTREQLDEYFSLPHQADNDKPMTQIADEIYHRELEKRTEKVKEKAQL